MHIKRLAEAGVGLLAAAALTALPLVHPAQAASQTATVTVNAAASLGQIPYTAYGLNTAVFDGYLTDPKVPPLLRKLDVGMLRYPGGSVSDIYDWQTNSIVPGQSSYAFPQNKFSNFMKVAAQVGAEPMITVNYGTNFTGTGGGTPAEAAAWVQYAMQHHDLAQYWEIGNEVYGGGFYPGADWETNLHSNKSPQGYANNVLKYVQAMRAVNPNIKIGAVLTLPYNYPWGLNPNWNQAVLTTDGPYINFVVVHWYPQNPGQESDAGLLATTNQVPAMLSRLKEEITKYAGSNASHIQIFLDETNSVSSNPGKQTTSVVNALFLANDFMSWLRGGVANVSWWDLHNGATAGNAASSLYGTTQYGDYGILSNGSSVNGISEPAPETPFPAYYGYQMLTTLARPGDTMVEASSNQGLVNAYAVRQRDGSLAVMVVNSDPANTYNVNLNLMGYRLFPGRSSIQEYTYGEGQSQVTETQVPAGQQLTVGPYSVATFVLRGFPGQPFFGPFFQATTQLSSSSVNPGQTETISTTFSAQRGTVRNGTLDVEVFNSSGQQVGQDLVPNVTLRPHQTDTVTYKWTAPNAPDTYTVRAFVFNQNLSEAYLADQNTGTFIVNAPPAPNAFTISATATPTSAAPGSNVQIAVTFTNASTNGGYLQNGTLDVEVHTVAGNVKVANGQTVAQTTLAPGQSQTLTETYTIPSTATAGTQYEVQAGVFAGFFGSLYSYNTDTATFTAN